MFPRVFLPVSRDKAVNVAIYYTMFIVNSILRRLEFLFCVLNT